MKDAEGSPPTPGYSVETVTHRIGADDYHIRSLLNLRQFWDHDGRAEQAGIFSASWPIFGVVWPAGIALAQEMSQIAIDGTSILEVGCGIGLSSLVLQRRGANVTASDYHPLAEEFLLYNAALNGLAPIKFLNAPWAGPNPDLGRFDLIIGSDVLYERDHPSLLACFLGCHAKTASSVVMADPGRMYCGQFNAKMSAQGYTRTERRLRFPGTESPFPRGRVMTFSRSHP